MHFQPHWSQHSYAFLKMIWWASFCPASSSPRELQYWDMSERDILWCVITNQNAKSQGSNLCARLDSLFRKPKLVLVHCSIHSYKPAAPGGPTELSPLTLEKPVLAWERCSRSSQGKPHQHSKPKPLPAPRTRFSQSQTTWFTRNGCSTDEDLVEPSIS